MEEFAKMIYEQWRNSQDGEDFDWGDYMKNGRDYMTSSMKR